MNKPTILVLHGLTMSGASMLGALGPLRDSLAAEGFDLVAPNGARSMSDAAVEGLTAWATPLYQARGQDAAAWFRDGVFWRDGAHHDWFGVREDRETGGKIYRALNESLDVVRRATEGRHIVGVIGFSQGAAMAAVVCGLAKKRELPFGDMLRFGVFLGGFAPDFDEPVVDPWPVSGMRSLVLTGSEDAIFPDVETLNALASLFEDPRVDRIDGLPHEVPSSPEWVERIRVFAVDACA